MHTMKYFGLLAIVLSISAAEIFFQEKFDEGGAYGRGIMGRLRRQMGEAHWLEEARGDGQVGLERRQVVRRRRG